MFASIAWSGQYLQLVYQVFCHAPQLIAFIFVNTCAVELDSPYEVGNSRSQISHSSEKSLHQYSAILFTSSLSLAITQRSIGRAQCLSLFKKAISFQFLAQILFDGLIGQYRSLQLLWDQYSVISSPLMEYAQLYSNLRARSAYLQKIGVHSYSWWHYRSFEFRITALIIFSSG